MKFCFIDDDSLSTLRRNIGSTISNYTKDSGDWVEAVLGKNPYIETKYGEIPDFSLDMSAEEPFATEAKNAEIVYKNLKFLSDSQASDERIWAALCLKDFWDYVQYRWIKGDVTEAKVKQHYFFGYGARRSLTRNALSRLWWIGRLTYDEKNEDDPFWLTKFVCENSDYIMHVLERNTSNNPMIIRGFLSAATDARKEGCTINTNTVGDLSKYLNLLGGTYILDCLPEQVIHDKILEKAREITRRLAEQSLQAEEQKKKLREEAQLPLAEPSATSEALKGSDISEEKRRPQGILGRLFGKK